MPLVGHQHQIDILELTDKGDGKGRLFDGLVGGETVAESEAFPTTANRCPLSGESGINHLVF